MIDQKQENEIKLATEYLLKYRWLIQQEMPEEYYLVKKYEKKLRSFFQVKFGWSLVATAKLYKLDKLPAEGKKYLGIKEFQSHEDYALLCCIMAFVENQDMDGQFLLGDLCEALMHYYPETDINPLSWESYSWRKTLIRVLNYLIDNKVLSLVDDKSDAFLINGYQNGAVAGEALYELTPITRYFIRNFKKPLAEYDNYIEMMDNELAINQGNDQDMAKVHRQRLYRKLLLQPAVIRRNCSEDETIYFRHQYNSIEADFIKYFDMELEMYYDSTIAISHEKKAFFSEIFPNTVKGIHDVVLLLSCFIKEYNRDGVQYLYEYDDFVALIEEFQNKYKEKWTKELREMSSTMLLKVISDELVKWEMLEIINNQFTINPVFFRFGGRYANDDVSKGDKDKNINKKSNRGRKPRKAATKGGEQMCLINGN